MAEKCEGSQGVPRRRRVTSRDLGPRYGGRLMGECPENGCDVLLTKGGRLSTHKIDPDGFARIVTLHGGNS